MAVAKVRDVAPGRARTVILAGRPIAVFNVRGTFYAVDDACLHRGGSLGAGSLEGHVVACPMHGWEYDVRTGANAANPSARLRTYRVVVEGEDVKVAP